MKKDKKTIIVAVIAIVVVIIIGFLGLFYGRGGQPSQPSVEKNPFFALGLANKGVLFIDVNSFTELNYTMKKEIPTAIKYMLANDSSYVYVAFNEPSPTLWRINFTYGEVTELPLPENLYINKLTVSNDILYAVAMDYSAHSAAVVKVDLATFNCSEKIILSEVDGFPYDMQIDGANWYLVSFNASTEISHLTKLDLSFNIIQTAEVSITGASHIAVGVNYVYLRGNDVVVAFNRSLVLAKTKLNIFGHGNMEFFGGKLYVAGYTNTGCPCVYVLAPQDLSIIGINALSEVSGTALHVLMVGDKLYVSAWESEVGASIFKVTDEATEKMTIPDTVASWPTDLLWFESETPK